MDWHWGRMLIDRSAPSALATFSWRALGLMAALAFAAGPGRPAAADTFVTPKVKRLHIDWQSAVLDLNSDLNLLPQAQVVPAFYASKRTQRTSRRFSPLLARVNAATSDVFPGINRSSVPVLLPFDVAGHLQATWQPDVQNDRDDHRFGFLPVLMFDAGPSGYDAIFALPREAAAKPRRYAQPIEIQITGSSLLYDISDPRAGLGQPVRNLQEQYPDLRRIIREGYVRYHFSRYGAAYVVSIACLDSVPRVKRLACREATDAAEHFLRSLRISGGSPSQLRPEDLAPQQVVRPAQWDLSFSYHPPGEILAGTGYKRQAGHADPTVYAQIRFPLERTPAFANSQSFLNWGDCFQRGRIPRPRKKDAPYRCAGSDKPLVFNEGAGENYAYPWRDNFCEARDFGVGQCATGRGHQGQDIRPSSCHLRNEGADRCSPADHRVVAVRDGVLIRGDHQQGVRLLVNTGLEHLRFRYMHMSPDQLNRDGVVHDRRVREGEPIGTVSNYQDHAGGTTNHLHFDVQVFTREGWLWVSPYATLIASYEELLGKRGRMIEPDLPEAPPEPAAVSDVTPAQPASQSNY